jgi:hypothetical protein
VGSKRLTFTLTTLAVSWVSESLNRTISHFADKSFSVFHSVGRQSAITFSSFIYQLFFFLPACNGKAMSTVAAKCDTCESRACGAIGYISDSGSEGMGFDPHSGQSKVRQFSLSILTDKSVMVVQSCRVPTSNFLGWFNPCLPNHQWWVRTLNSNCHVTCD